MAKLYKVFNMAENKSTQQEELQVAGWFEKSQDFLEENQQKLTYVLGGLLIFILGFMGYRYFFIIPKEKQANEQIFMAQYYFESDSFSLALLGDGNYMGFEELADNFGSTKPGNLSKYYAGICHLNLGNFDDAIQYLTKFKTKDPLLKAVSLGATGDAYSELGENDKAIELYKKAAEASDNEITGAIYLSRAAILSKLEENYSEALKLYISLKDKYPGTTEAEEAEKNIAFLEQKN